MSLLIPTSTDYNDAHQDQELEQQYALKLEHETAKQPSAFRWSFETVPGFFVQADEETDDLKFRYTESNMGRKKTWAQIQQGLTQLNENAAPNECYKLILCARHGQGYHNQVVDKYGLDAWYAKWHCLGTDGHVEYGPDAMLTEVGIAQAQENHTAWENEIKLHGAPIPAKFYVSPLQRSCWTCHYTWTELRPENSHPLVVEKMRETIGQNLCDKRSTRSEILRKFGPLGFEVEAGFAEQDELFTDKRESNLAQAIRINEACQDVFEEDWDENSGTVDKRKALRNSIISTTTHAGTIRSFIVVFGHRRFTVSTGGMIPFVVKATRIRDQKF